MAPSFGEWVTITTEDVSEPAATCSSAAMDTEEDIDLERLRSLLAKQLRGLEQAVAKETGEEARGYSKPSSAQQPPTDFLPLRDHYEQALDQAMELYAITDPDVGKKAVVTAATEAAGGGVSFVVVAVDTS